MTHLISNVDTSNIQGTSEPNNSDVSVMSRREVGTRNLDLAVDNTTADLKYTRVEENVQWLWVWLEGPETNLADINMHWAAQEEEKLMEEHPEESSA